MERIIEMMLEQANNQESMEKNLQEFKK